MKRALLVVFGLSLFAGCSKKAAPAGDKAGSAVAQEVARVTSADGTTRIAIEANKDGYTPARIPGKPGEKLVLVFTRTAALDCISKLKTPDGKLVDLPLGKPVEVPVTVPATGEVGFACGMDMFHGVVVATPSS